ncbi:hypothetical protein GALL_399620 [mine drainage metagenome]|uniref:Uncharacterized protein n=1 Tax=mine drainage metagenome TaxID=410659 RepID=A0A1J5Q3S3_9ZZZZ
MVVIGDSISDSNDTMIDTNSRWPDFLVARLVSRNVVVLNAGISEARLLGDRLGVNALARFDRDVLSQLHPARFKSEFDSGDHLHPWDRGNRTRPMRSACAFVGASGVF